MKYAAMEIPNEPLNQVQPRRASHTAGSSPGPSSGSGTPPVVVVAVERGFNALLHFPTFYFLLINLPCFSLF